VDHGDREAWKALGEFIRAQRKLARLSLRQMAQMTRISNPYLSQVERGLYRPSAQVLKSIADCLNLSAEAMYARVGLLDREPGAESGVEEAIRLDAGLAPAQKAALLEVYRGFAEANRSAAGAAGRARRPWRPGGA